MANVPESDSMTHIDLSSNITSSFIPDPISANHTSSQMIVYALLSWLGDIEGILQSSRQTPIVAIDGEDQYCSSL